MNILIFEGIATSGKTTVEKRLLEKMADAKVIEETETLMPLIDNHDIGLARGHLNQLLDRIEGQNYQYVIFDRFHLTHAFRTKAEISDFADIEERLKSLGDVLVVLLMIDQRSIRSRIEETMEYRKGGWNQGSQGATTIEEKIDYYTRQQKTLRGLIAGSGLPHLEIDTTSKNWEAAVESIRLHLRNL